MLCEWGGNMNLLQNENCKEEEMQKMVVPHLLYRQF